MDSLAMRMAERRVNASPDKVNILLVDDQPGKLLTYETMLAGLGENLVKAASGDEALQHPLKTEFAVILVDVCMPGLDGFELAGMIRQHPRCQKTAIIFISAVQVTNLDQLKGYEHGAVDYVSVPVVPELLRARVMVFADLFRKTQALEDMNLKLEQRVAERTAELERDLAERKRLEAELIESARRKDEFLATLAHELRNPLAPVRSAVDILKLKPLDDPDLLACHSVIERQIEHMTRLVDDLMDISRISRGSITLERQPLEVSAIVARAVEMQRPMFDERRQTLTVEQPPAALVVEGDLTRLAEVLCNLLNNASKYTHEEGHIGVRVEAPAGGKEVLIRVKDNGTGIPPEMLPKVFDMFTQVDSTLKRAQGGLGIGLSLVRKLAGMHGGSVEGFSEGLGKGCEFVLRLPLRQDLRLPQPAAAPETLGPLTDLRVLVVDDNRDAALMLTRMLRMRGAEVESLHEAVRTVETARRFRPQVVLLDIGMPGMSGLEVARALRAQTFGKKLRLIAVTGWSQDHDRQRSHEAGFDAHVAKPIDHARLTQLLTGFSKRKEAVQPAKPVRAAVSTRA